MTITPTRHRASAWIAAGLALVPATAGAGALGKVVNGLEHATGSNDGQRGGAGGDSKSDSQGSGTPAVSDDPWERQIREDPTAPLFYAGPYPSYPAGAPPTVSLYFGLQSVEDSDGAAAFGLRTGYGDYGISLADTSYYERVPQNDGRDDTLRLDVWAISLAYRVAQASEGDATSVWLHGGIAGANSNSNTEAQALGAVVGAEITHNVSGSLGIEASGRYFVLQDDVRATELRAGVAASVLRLSYRILDFNVGPPLRGPEVGLALSF